MTTIFVQTLQETRILREVLSSAAAMAKAAGWAGVFSPAEREGARGPGSAGLAILARSHLDIKEIVPPTLEGERPSMWNRGRWHSACIGGFSRPLVLINTCAFPGQGAKGDNATLISEVGNFINQLVHGWWQWSGDSNMEERELLGLRCSWDPQCCPFFLGGGQPLPSFGAKAAQPFSRGSRLVAVQKEN